MLTRHSTEVTQDGPCVVGEDSEVPSMPAEREELSTLEGKSTICPQTMEKRVDSYLEKGSDFPTGNPLPWVLVSTFPQ